VPVVELSKSALVMEEQKETGYKQGPKTLCI
jgi:hypothetical protein